MSCRSVGLQVRRLLGRGLDRPNLRRGLEAVNLHMRSQPFLALIGLGQSPGRGHHRHVIRSATSRPPPPPCLISIPCPYQMPPRPTPTRTEKYHHLLIGLGRPAKPRLPLREHGAMLPSPGRGSVRTRPLPHTRRAPGCRYVSHRTGRGALGVRCPDTAGD